MEVPAVGPVTVLVTDVLPVTTGLFVIATRVVDSVVEKIEVVLVELVEEVLLVDEAKVVVTVTTEFRIAQPIAAHGLLVNVAAGLYAVPDACSKAFRSPPRPFPFPEDKSTP